MTPPRINWNQVWEHIDNAGEVIGAKNDLKVWKKMIEVIVNLKVEQLVESQLRMAKGMK